MSDVWHINLLLLSVIWANFGFGSSSGQSQSLYWTGDTKYMQSANNTKIEDWKDQN